MINFGLSLNSLALQRRQTAITLDLTGSTLPNGVNLSRASAAVLRTGLTQYQSVAQDVARLGFGLEAAVNTGLLIENAATNLLAHSLPTASTWTSVSATLTDRSSTDLGLFTGISIASQGGSWNRAATDITVTNGATYAVSTYVRVGTSGRLRIRLRDGSGGNESRISGSFGSLSMPTGQAGTTTDLTQTILADGVTHHICFLFTPNFSGTLNFGVGPDSSTAGETVEFLAAQLELGTQPSSFIVTGATASTRAADIPVLNNWTGLYDVIATFSDASTQTFAAQSVASGYWPTGLTGHIATLELHPA